MRPGFAVIGAAIPVSDFAGMVMAILSDANPEETCAFSMGNKTYGLPFCEGDEEITNKRNDSLFTASFFIV